MQAELRAKFSPSWGISQFARDITVSKQPAGPVNGIAENRLRREGDILRDRIEARSKLSIISTFYNLSSAEIVAITR